MVANTILGDAYYIRVVGEKQVNEKSSTWGVIDIACGVMALNTIKRLWRVQRGIKAKPHQLWSKPNTLSGESSTDMKQHLEGWIWRNYRKMRRYNVVGKLRVYVCYLSGIIGSLNERGWMTQRLFSVKWSSESKDCQTQIDLHSRRYVTLNVG